MFEGMKAKSLDISKADYQELKKWQGHRQENVKLIFQTASYQRLSLEYKNRVYQTLNQLQDRELDILEDDVLINFWRFFRNWAITTSENYYYYLNVLLDYPIFPIINAYLFAEYPDENDQKLLDYTRIEAKLYSLEEDFCYYAREFEDIVKDEKLRELGLTDIVINGIINTHLPKNEIVCYISNLIKENNYWLIFKLFQAPTSKHIELVLKLVNDKEVAESSHIEEMIDMIYATPLDELKEMGFKITPKLIYKEMTFKDACGKYLKQAMELLDESREMKSTTLVRVPIYERR